MNISLNGDFTIDELREILSLAENQGTTDKSVDTSLHIEGNYATIDADINEDGDICVNKSPNEFLVCDSDNECIYGTVRTDKSKEEVQNIINDVKRIEFYSSWDLEERFDEEGISYTEGCAKVYF
jgi:hypothetical protein